MKLKNSVKAEEILQREHSLLDRAKQRLAPVDNFVLLGNAFQDSKQYLPVLSFFIKSPKEFENSQLYLHHNFVASLLNDLFGIQARGGCACAGPYAQHLMGMD